MANAVAMTHAGVRKKRKAHIFLRNKRSDSALPEQDKGEKEERERKARPMKIINDDSSHAMLI